MDSEKSEILFSKGFLACVAIQFLGYMAFGMTMPVLPVYVVSIGNSAAAAGVVTGLFAFCALALRPISGFVADRMNKLHLQTVGFVICAIGSAGYALSWNLSSVVFFRIVHSIGFCLQSTVTIAITLSMLPKGREGEGVGYFSLTQVIASATAPVLGVALAGFAGCRATFLLDSACVLAGSLISTRIPYQDIRSGEKRSLSCADFISRKSIPLASIAALFAICSGITSSFIVLLGDSRGIEGTAVFFTVSAVLMFFTRPKAGKIIDNRGIVPVLFPSFFFEAAVMLIIAFAHNVYAIVVAGLLRAFGQGMAQPSVQAQIMLQEGPERSGVASSTFNLGLDIGQGVGAVLGGVLAAQLGYGAPFAAAPFGLLIGLIVFFAFRSSMKKEVIS